MKNKSNYTELVQKYLNNELDAQELDAFEVELKQNELLEEELNLQKKVDAFIQDDELENFKLELDKVYDNLTGKRRKNRSFNNGYFALIAATVIVLITLGIVFLNGGNNQMNCDEIFDEYYEGYPSSYTKRSLNSCGHDSLYYRAIIQYNSKNFVAAESGLFKVIKAHPNNIAANFYLGIVYIELEEYANAIIYFNKVIESKDPYYQEQSEWYKLMSTTKLNDKASVISQLNTIIEKNGFYCDRASEILSLVD